MQCWRQTLPQIVLKIRIFKNTMPGTGKTLSGRKGREKKKKKMRKRHSREIKALKEKLKKVTKQRNKLRKQKWRRRKATNKIPLDSPGTETERMLSGSKIKNPKIKKALLFHNILRRELKKNT